MHCVCAPLFPTAVYGCECDPDICIVDQTFIGRLKASRNERCCNRLDIAVVLQSLYALTYNRVTVLLGEPVFLR